jgi:hypothetical protein
MEWYEFDGVDHLQTFADMKASGMKIIRLTANGYWNYWKVSSLITLTARPTSKRWTR